LVVGQVWASGGTAGKGGPHIVGRAVVRDCDPGPRQRPCVATGELTWLDIEMTGTLADLAHARADLA
jgi:hypothetical protein